MAGFQSLLRLSLVSLLLLSVARASSAREPLERFLPPTTKAFVAVTDIDRALARWEKTQLGQLMAEPMMQPFVEEMRTRFQGDVLALNDRLGVQIDELRQLRAGEVALAFVQPQGATSEHSAVLLMDIAGREHEAKEMLNAIAIRHEEKGAIRTHISAANGASIVKVQLPPLDEVPAKQSFMMVHRERMLITDRLDVANEIVALLDGGRENLGGLASFKAVMKAGGESEPDLRWFVEPFGLVEVLRAAQITKPLDGSVDILEVLSNQGFRAIEGIGGHIRLATGKHEILHRTMVYAPGRKTGPRFDLAARMLSFPNSKNMTPKVWVPSSVTTHMTFRFDLRNAFEYSKSLVNEYAGEQVFDEIIKNIETDPNGPQINLREELFGKFSDRITVLADNVTPINAESERVAVAIELTDEAAVRASIEKAMRNDPSALPHSVGPYRIWQMGAVEEEAPEEIVLMIDDPFASNPFGPAPEPEEDTVKECDSPEETEKVLANMCVVVANGHLIASKKLEFIREILTWKPGTAKLNESDDFSAVRLALQQLGSDSDCARYFVRTDRAYQPTYEMLRTDQMPESKSMLGQLLNQALKQNDPDRPRMQRINGATMPPFDSVRRYLGPAGAFTRTTDEGWIMSGCLLRNPAGA